MTPMSRFSPNLPWGVRRLFRLPGNRDRMLRDMDEEMRHHLAMRVDYLRTRGMSQPEAEAEARGAEKPQEQLDYWDKLLELTSSTGLPRRSTPEPRASGATAESRSRHHVLPSSPADKTVDTPRSFPCCPAPLASVIARGARRWFQRADAGTD